MEEHFKLQIVIFTSLRKRNKSKAWPLEHKPSIWSPTKLVFFTNEYNGLHLLPTLTFNEICPRLKSSDALLRIQPCDFLKLHGKTCDSNLIFNDNTIQIMENILDLSIHVYEVQNSKINRQTPIVRGQLTRPCVNIAVNDADLISSSQAEFFFIANEKVFTSYYCCSKCPFTTTHKNDLHKHETKAYNCGEYEVTTKSKQQMLGDSTSLLTKAVQRGYLPSSMINFRQTYLAVFDTETLEEKCITDEVVVNERATTTEAVHRLVSIAISTNLPGQKDIYLVRQSSNPECERTLIKEFLDALEGLHSVYTDQLPKEINSAIQQIERDLLQETFSRDKTQLEAIKNYLYTYMKLPIYGFNAGMFCFLLKYSPHYFSITVKKWDCTLISVI